MANHLDLEEQEQLDQLKHFWKQYGNLITWILIAVLGSIAAWNGYQAWQRNQSMQAAAMFDEVERVARGGDVEKTQRAFSEMTGRFARTTYAQQSGLLLGKMAFDAGKMDSAKAALEWVVQNGSDPAYVAIARLRLSGVLLETKAYDDALKTLSTDFSDDFVGLVADRKADIYMLQNKKNEARTEYQKAYKAFDDRSEYRRLVEVKLNALGANSEQLK